MIKKIISALALMLVFVSAAAQSEKSDRPMLTPDQKLRMATALIQSYYVEDVDGQKMADEAIIAMLKTLDPHSSYSDPEETKELTQPLEGKFSGIGIQFNAATDTVYVIQTIAGGPSEKVGIRPGDRIIQADDSIIAGRKLPNSAILKILRGEKGSKVNLKVKRGGQPELIDFVVVRDDVPIHSVDAAYMANDSTGYIRVSRFAEDTADEVAEAVDRLRAKGMKNLMLDLQDNGGGYLGAAVELASQFLSKGDPVVFTKGLHSQPAYYNLDKDGNLKIVVLETLIVRREQDDARTLSSTQTELLVENGQIIEPRTPVTKTQVLSVDNSIASIKSQDKDLRRLLLVSEKYEQKVPVKSKATVKAGEFVKLDSVISSSGDTSTASGQVIAVNKDSVTVRLGRPHLISPGTLLQVENGALILRGDLLATLVFERQKTGDIVQGLPRVEELLEARKPKDSAIVAEEDGVAEVEIEDDVARLYIVNENGRTEIKYPIESSVIVMDKQKITKGQPLTSGPLNPHDVIRLRGTFAAQQYLVDEVQRVYRSQGVEIADKHVEVIVRQMSKKVKVVDSGTTKLLPGELVELKVIEAENARVEAEGGEVATYEALLLGITKASLNTESFISAASFQETTRILTEAAVEGKKDLLRGLKENVIIGRLIPAGTGYHHLINANEEKEKEALKRAQQKNQARKPSAILEEIEGMFGTPDFTIE